jgi:hypothetical protein
VSLPFFSILQFQLVPSSSRTPIPGTVFTAPVESSNENSSPILTSTTTTQVDSTPAETVVPISDSAKTPLTNQDPQEDELFNQLLQSNATTLSSVDDDADNDEKVWDSFNDVISQVH